MDTISREGFCTHGPNMSIVLCDPLLMNVGVRTVLQVFLFINSVVEVELIIAGFLTVLVDLYFI